MRFRSRDLRTTGRFARRTACVVALVVCGCGRTPPEPGLLWRVGAMSGSRAGGDVLVDGGETWIAYEDDVVQDAGRIRIVHLDPKQRKVPYRVVAVVEGDAPSLARSADGGFILVHALRAADGEKYIVQRRAPPGGDNWSAPQPLGASGARIASDRLAIGGDTAWFVPAVRDSANAARIVLFRSRDAGVTWQESPVASLAGAADAAIAVQGATLLVIARRGNALVQCTSTDDGATWSAFAPIAVATAQIESTPHCLISDGVRLRLAWTDAAADSGVALPAVRALRLSESTDAGRTWSRGVPIVWRAGSIPCAPSLSIQEQRATVLFTDRSTHAAEIICFARERDAAVRPAGAAASALRLWAQHTLARPMTSQRLFIEGYFMRGLVSAHTILRRTPSLDAPLDTPAGLQRAMDFADWMLSGQTGQGYWPLGYKAVYIADMAAVVALYADLTPHVEPERAGRYVASAEKFAAALVRDRMLLPSGAAGIGWPETRTPSESTAVRTPYLVSTSLAGVGVHAWLYSRTQNAVYRERALQSLEYTLSQIRPDGSLAGLEWGEQTEGPFLIAAYVQEGWMAADAYLQDKAALERLRRELPAHVDWLVRSQRTDGTWDSGADGEFARTPPIVSFLVWYQQRCSSHAGARAAVERAAVSLTDPDRWITNGILRAGKHEEVLRALASRPLATLAGEGANLPR